MFTAPLQGSRFGYTDECNTESREEVLLPLLENGYKKNTTVMLQIGASSSTHTIYTQTINRQVLFWPVIMLLTQSVLITVVTAEVFVTTGR